MRLVHYSEDIAFVPTAQAGHGMDEPGCFFYLWPHEQGGLDWPGRYRSEWEAPDEVGEVENDFAPGEVGNRQQIVEIFVPAAQLAQLRDITRQG